MYADDYYPVINIVMLVSLAVAILGLALPSRVIDEIRLNFGPASRCRNKDTYFALAIVFLVLMFVPVVNWAGLIGGITIFALSRGC